MKLDRASTRSRAFQPPIALARNSSDRFLFFFYENFTAPGIYCLISRTMSADFIVVFDTHATTRADFVSSAITFPSSLTRSCPLFVSTVHGLFRVNGEFFTQFREHLIAGLMGEREGRGRCFVYGVLTTVFINCRWKHNRKRSVDVSNGKRYKGRLLCKTIINVKVERGCCLAWLRDKLYRKLSTASRITHVSCADY